METIRYLLENGLKAGIAMAAILAGFAGFLYRLVKFTRPKEERQENQRMLSHRLYHVSGRGRAAYLLLCLEETLQFYKQDFGDWEWSPAYQRIGQGRPTG